MSYDTSKLTKLSALKALAERIHDTVGETNVLEKIKVNGTLQAITDKTVDITIPTKVSELTNDSNYQTGTEVSDTVAAEIAKVVADAPESLDTLKEIADWISSHSDSASSMNSTISSNADDIAALKALVGTLPASASSTTIVGYIDEAIAALSIGDYAKSSEVTETINTALKSYVTTSALNTILSSYYSSSQIDSKLESYVLSSQIATDAEVEEMLVETFGE